MKKLIAILILFLAFSGGAKAATVVNYVDFEDVGTTPYGYTLLDYKYHDATWINFGVVDSSYVDASDPTNNNSAYIPAAKSPTKVAVNMDGGTAGIIFDNNYNLNSAWFATSYYQPNIITITGTYGDDTPFILNPLTLSLGSGQWYDFSLLGTTTSVTGVKTLTFQSDNQWFGMDNLSYTLNPAPEPASMVLGLISLTGLLGAKKKSPTSIIQK